jgi:hypothetical protein
MVLTHVLETDFLSMLIYVDVNLMIIYVNLKPWNTFGINIIIC